MTELDTNANRTPEDEPLFALFQSYETIPDEVYAEVLRFVEFVFDVDKKEKPPGVATPGGRV